MTFPLSAHPLPPRALKSRRSSPSAHSLLRRSVAAAVVFAVAASLSACGDDAEGEELGSETIVDVDRTRLITPGRQMTLTWDEAADISYAASITYRQCMRDAGFAQGPAYNIRDELQESAYTEIGVWTESIASRFGYDPIPASKAKEELLSRTDEAADEQAPAKCSEDPSVGPYFDIDREFTDSVWNGILSNSVIDEDTRQRLHADWAACMKAEGVATRADSYLPVGVETMSQEESITTALTDVGCKQSTGFIDDWAQMLAAEEAPYLMEKKAELEDFRTRALKVRESAQEVIAEYEKAQG